MALSQRFQYVLSFRRIAVFRYASHDMKSPNEVVNIDFYNIQHVDKACFLFEQWKLINCFFLQDRVAPLSFYCSPEW